MNRYISCKLWILIPLLLAKLPVSGWSISETDYQMAYQRLIVPFYASGVTGELPGVNGVRLAWWKKGAPSARKAVIILTGLNESLLKYKEVAYDMYQAGYAVYMLDHRGMGLSQRLVPEARLPVDVADFADYVHDVRRFIVAVVEPDGPEKLFMLAHSMGGCVAVNYLTVYNGVVAAALSAPMLEINTGKFPVWLVYMGTGLATWRGNGQAYAPGQGPRQPAVFDDSALTSSWPRWAAWNANILINRPEVASGGVTNRWVLESLRGIRHARHYAANITTPLLILSAGQDTVVKPGGQQEVCERSAICTLLELPAARHEILMEADTIRNQALHAVLQFFEAAAKKLPAATTLPAKPGTAEPGIPAE